MKRDPDWSLGSFSRSLVVRVGADPYNTSAPILKVIDKYEFGQPCDETGGVGRKTDVHMMCCEKDSIEKLNAQSPKDRNAIARIKSIVEPETCVYEMFICVQMLCNPDKSNKQLQPPNSRARSDKMQQEDKLPLSKFFTFLSNSMFVQRRSLVDLRGLFWQECQAGALRICIDEGDAYIYEPTLLCIINTYFFSFLCFEYFHAHPSQG